MTLLREDCHYTLYDARLQQEGLSEEERRAALKAAGWLETSLTQDQLRSTAFLSAGYPMVTAPDSVDKEIAVLITTGCYNPFHEGHLAMMLEARKYVEERLGEKVVAGFFSVGHDQYIQEKTPGSPHGLARIEDARRYLNTANQDHWLHVDSFEATGVSEAINFTEVIQHIRTMLKRYSQLQPKIYYVFGSDNQSFAPVFDHGDPLIAAGICVGRPGYPFTSEAQTSTLHYILGNHDASSTSVREQQGTAGLIPQKLPLFVIRNDFIRSMDWLRPLMGQQEFYERYRKFIYRISQAFKESYVEVSFIDVEEQLELTRRKIAENYAGIPALSGDIYLQTEYKLRASRLFTVSSYQAHAYGHTPLKVPADLLNAETIVFVDDDIHSGEYVAMVKKILPSVIGISMADYSYPHGFSDIVDMRDFILGATEGGLGTMGENQKFVRVPYLHPFTNLCTRASIAPEKVLQLNVELYRANYDFYAGTGIQVSDVPLPAQASPVFSGFTEDTLLSDIAKYYGTPLESLC